MRFFALLTRAHVSKCVTAVTASEVNGNEFPLLPLLKNTTYFINLLFLKEI
jgi:hypothetical protein